MVLYNLGLRKHTFKISAVSISYDHFMPFQLKKL